MRTLAQDVAVLEAAHAQGRLKGRDLDVIKTQLARAEEKIIKATRGSPLAAAMGSPFTGNATGA